MGPSSKQAGTMILSNQYKVPYSIPGFTIEFCLVENFPVVCTDWLFLCINIRGIAPEPNCRTYPNLKVLNVQMSMYYV